MVTAEGCVFFLYDTQKWKKLKSEEDDLLTAISYFFPTTWGPERKFWLCGPLMTAANQVSRILGHTPEVIKLRKTKFALIHTERFTLVFGGEREFGDRFILEICRHILRMIQLLYPSLGYLLDSVESDHILGGLIQTIVTKMFLATQFLPFLSSLEAPRRHLQKYIHVMEFVARQRDVLGCSLLLRKRVVRSNVGPNLTRMIQLCAACDILCTKAGIVKQGCSFFPIFLSIRDCKLMMEKQKRRRASPCEESSEYHSASIAYSHTKCSTNADTSDASRSIELALYFITVDNCCLAAIMKAANRESVNISKHILDSCANDMKMISDEISEGTTTIDLGGEDDDLGLLESPLKSKCIASVGDDVDFNSSYIRSTFRNSKCAFTYEKLFDRQNVIFEA